MAAISNHDYKMPLGEKMPNYEINNLCIPQAMFSDYRFSKVVTIISPIP